MSRFLLLLIFVLWMSSPDQPALGAHGPWVALGCFVGFYGLLVVVMGLWSRSVARRVHLGDLQRRLTVFNRMMYMARLMVPGWFAVGVYVLGWKMLVDDGI